MSVAPALSFVLPVWLLLQWAVLGMTDANAQPVADPGQPAAEVSIAADGVQLAPVDGDGFVAAHFEPVAAPTVRFAPAAGAWDWRAASAFKVHLQNAMAWPVTVRVTVRDAGGAALQTELGLPPGPPQTVAVPLAPVSPRAYGLLAAPTMPWVRTDPAGGAERMFVATDVRGALDPAKVASVSFEIPAPAAPQVLRIGKLFTEPRESGRDDLRDAYSGLIDSFGQSTRGDWPQKVTSLAALKAAGAEEDRLLARQVPPAGDEGPRRLATGFFRVERLPAAPGGERWWLIDPDGRRFFSIGVNAVRSRGDDTIIEGREFMFVDLPPQRDDPRFAQVREPILPADSGAARGRAFTRGRSLDFYRLNLWRRDGDAFESRWRARTRQRLQAWSFNTVGNWSEEALVRDAQLPFVKPIEVAGEFATISDGLDYWGRAPDPFDQRFTQAVRQAVEAGTRELRTERRLIGYFVDNEVAWGDGGSDDWRRRYALAIGTLRQDAAASPAKRAFIDLLKRRHIDVRRLSALWGVRLTSWAALGVPLEPPKPSAERPAIAEDYSAFLALHADTYFGTIQHELKRVDPNHLYLGTRFAMRTPEAVAACARWCDIVSFNLYLPTLAAGFDAQAFRKLGRPALLTEFHFGATDRGPFGGGVIAVPRSSERGRAYRAMLDSVVDNPDFVGAHWFQYVDEPASGRWLDGENMHIGLVSITDAPWNDFVGDVAQANRAALKRLMQQ